VAIARAREQGKKGKQVISKARLLSKNDADRLRADIEAKEAADIVYKAAMEEKKKEQARKKAAGRGGEAREGNLTCYS
jgi:hypothetical protein